MVDTRRNSRPMCDHCNAENCTYVDHGNGEIEAEGYGPKEQAAYAAGLEIGRQECDAMREKLEGLRRDMDNVVRYVRQAALADGRVIPVWLSFYGE